MEKCRASEIIDIVSSHPITLIKQNGKWRVVESFEHRVIERELKMHARQQAVLIHLSLHALSGTDISELMNDAAMLTAQTLGVDRCGILELSGDVLVLRSGFGWDDVEANSEKISPYESFEGYVLKTGEPVAVEDVTESATESTIESKNAHWQICLGHDVSSAAAAAMYGRERPFGVLAVYSTKPKKFTDDEIHFIQSVANVLAIAIERKRVEDELRRNEMRFHSLIRHSSDIILVIDSEGMIRFVSPSVERILGYSPDEVTGTSVFDYLHPEEIEIARIKFLSLLKKPGVTAAFEFRVLHSDGSWRYMEAIANNLLGNPVIDGIVMNVRDVSERRQMEEELRQLKDFNERIIQSMEEGILIENEEGFITFVNPRMLKMLDCSKDEVIGKHWSEIFSSDFEKELQEANLKLRKGESARFEAALKVKDRELIVIVSATPLFESGVYAGNLKVLVDITERKEAEERLRHRALKYKIEKGRSYLILEKSLDKGADVFKDLLHVGYRGLVISRTPPEDLMRILGEDVEILWLSEKKKGKGVISPELLLLEKIIEDFASRESVVLLDRLDYLILIHGFDEVLKFLTKLNELIYLSKGVLLIVVDPDTLSDRERIRLEKEVQKVEPKYRIELEESLLEILRFIKKENDLGRKPAHKDVMKAFGVTQPTATKKLKELKNLGLISEKKDGRFKVLELTERGKEVLY
jgi:PAS domain S-box-containing protein